MKKYTKTAFSLILTLGIISAASNANALFGMFDDEKDPLKEERRSPVLNGSAGYVTAPDPNLIYGSMPTSTDQLAIPQDLGTVAMPPMPAMPEATPAPMQLSSNMAVDSMGYPQLSAMPQMPAAPVVAAPGNQRIEALRQDLQTSNQMASANGYTPVAAEISMPVAPMMPAPMLAPMPEPQAVAAPAFEPAPYTPQEYAAAPQVSAQPEPVLPTSSNSVTVRSKRSRGLPVPEQVAQAPQETPIIAPMISAPAPSVEVASVPLVAPATSNEYIPMPQKIVDESFTPVASNYDSPNDNFGANFGVSNNSYTVASNGKASYSSNFVNRRPVMLPQSRYANYRKTGNK